MSQATLEEITKSISDLYTLLINIGVITDEMRKIITRKYHSRKNALQDLDTIIQIVSEKDPGWNSISTPDCVVEACLILSYRR